MSYITVKSKIDRVIFFFKECALPYYFNEKKELDIAECFFNGGELE